MREFRTSGSVGDGVGNDPIYPANPSDYLEIFGIATGQDLERGMDVT
jgi:hypothetical protein